MSKASAEESIGPLAESKKNTPKISEASEKRTFGEEALSPRFEKSEASRENSGKRQKLDNNTGKGTKATPSPRSPEKDEESEHDSEREGSEEDDFHAEGDNEAIVDMHEESRPRYNPAIGGVLQPSIFPAGVDPADKELQQRIVHPSFQAGLRLMQEGLQHTAGCSGRPWDHVNGCACLQRQGRPGRRKAPVIVSETDLMAFPRRQLDEFVHRSGLERPQYAEYVRYMRELWNAHADWKRRLPDDVCDLGRGHLNEFRQMLSSSGLTANGICFLKEERDRSMNRQHQHAHRVRRKTTSHDDNEYEGRAGPGKDMQTMPDPQTALLLSSIMSSAQAARLVGLDLARAVRPEGAGPSPAAVAAAAAAAGQYGGMFPFSPYAHQLDMSLLSGLVNAGQGMQHGPAFGPPVSQAAQSRDAVTSSAASSSAPGMSAYTIALAQAMQLQNLMYPRAQQQSPMMAMMGQYGPQPQPTGVTEGPAPQPASSVAHTPNELDAAHNLSLIRSSLNPT